MRECFIYLFESWSDFGQIFSSHFYLILVIHLRHLQQNILLRILSSNFKIKTNMIKINKIIGCDICWEKYWIRCIVLWKCLRQPKIKIGQKERKSLALNVFFFLELIFDICILRKRNDFYTSFFLSFLHLNLFVYLYFWIVFDLFNSNVRKKK